MTTRVTNINVLMECPICGDKTLQLQNLQLSADESENMISFRCLHCSFEIYDEARDTIDITQRLAGQPLNFFKEEIEKRNKHE